MYGKDVAAPLVVPLRHEREDMVIPHLMQIVTYSDFVSLGVDKESLQLVAVPSHAIYLKPFALCHWDEMCFLDRIRTVGQDAAV